MTHVTQAGRALVWGAAALQYWLVEPEGAKQVVIPLHIMEEGVAPAEAWEATSYHLKCHF